jgi:hypothetical protein
VDGNDVVAVYTTAKEAVERARAGEGPILIEAKSMRMRGHAQHDPAEYVPKEMFEYWKARDPIVLYEKFLTGEKLLDAKSKKEIEDRIETLLTKERDFAESSPMPPAEFANEGVYCTGDECHKIAAKWERSKTEVTPPRSSIAAVWSVEGFGEGKGSAGRNAPIHFGDTTPASPELGENESKLAPKTPAKTVIKKVVASNGKGKTQAAVGKNGAKNGASQKQIAPPVASRVTKKPAPASTGKRR